ncbi:radical SAM protein [Clostridium sp. MSJ-11]|uniref:Radical SAM protein n=1 Tax=Clostridium mobile TaxID=2841512 RepID=A0ABS6ED78_9CLOT|nr:radical SAM protein [Clostridium mobile]MBU5482752.1 radical SAM protein [Clostridium mobile]
MNKKHYIIPIFVPHEGCPHNCVFCNQNAITGNVIEVDEKYVEDIINTYLDTIDTNNSIIEVSFFGGTFTAIDINKQRKLLSVAKKYKDMGRIQYIRLSTRPDYIDSTILDNLKKYSVDIIELGVQSMDDEVLKHSGRGHTEDDVIRASQLIKEYGFTLGHQIMLGLPRDSFKKDIETTKKIINLKPELCRIYPSLVVKNTPMEIMYRDKTYIPYTLEEGVEISKIIYGMLLANGINVIRVGLQPTEEINVGKEIVEGPFHPAFRELVESSILNDMIYEFLLDKKVFSIKIAINNKSLSKLYSNKKQYYKDILNKLELPTMQVITDESLDKDTLKIWLNGEEHSMSITTYIWQKYKEGNFRNL